MKRVDLVLYEHNIKIGDTCGNLKPNVTEDSIFYADGEPIGFYLKEAPTKLKQLAEIANAELLSDRVPKEVMSRGPNSEFFKKMLAEKGMKHVDQFSTILGSCAPRPHMRMPYPRISRVHEVESAQTFIKAMLLACHEAEELIKELAPNVYEKQLKAVEENVPPRFRFGRLFTSSISNFNIAKRSNAKGGNTTVPDYDATVDSSDNSILVYPAWRNVHGVTPIIPLKENGYRNTLVFYALKAFKNHW
jgi:hypothetical protein